MQQSFLVAIKCPECGAPIRYPEGAYSFTCSYCGSVLRIQREGVVLKYIIPARLSVTGIRRAVKEALAGKKGSRAIARVQTVYKPFWYFKGMLYYSFVGTEGNETLAKTWYYSFQAHREYVPSFRSLSVRTEVLTLAPFDSEAAQNAGTVLSLTVDRDEAYAQASRAAEKGFQALVSTPVYRKLTLIGEHFFIIYYPIVQVDCTGDDGDRTIMIDGVNKSILEDEPGTPAAESQHHGDAPAFRSRLLTHRCNNCGHDLKAGDFDIVFYCDVCTRLWFLRGDEYQCLNVTVLEPAGQEGAVFMPFWRFETGITSETTGVEMNTIGDLSTFMKMGRFLLRHQDPSRPIRIYVPALTARDARALMKLASQINIHQKLLPLSPRKEFPFTRMLHASLPDDEAEEMLWVVVFAMIGRRDRKALDFYRDFTVSVTKKEMVWYPFEEKGNNFVDHFHNFHFPRKSLDLRVSG